MQPTTNPQNSQLSPSELRAHLGVVTGMMQNMIPQGQQDPNAPQTQETAPQETKKEEPKQQPVEEVKAEMELEMNKKLDEIRKEMKQDQQRDLDEMKQLITSALAEEDKNEQGKTEKPA